MFYFNKLFSVYVMLNRRFEKALTVQTCRVVIKLIFLNQFSYLVIYLFLAALGLRCWMQAFSSCSEWGLLFVAVRELLIVVASLVSEHGL